MNIAFIRSIVYVVLLFVATSICTISVQSQETPKDQKISKALEKTQKNWNLTHEQTLQVKVIREDASKQRKEAKGKPNEKELIKNINKESEQKVKSLLTEEQKTTIKEKARAKRKEKKALKDKKIE